LADRVHELTEEPLEELCELSKRQEILNLLRVVRRYRANLVKYLEEHPPLTKFSIDGGNGGDGNGDGDGDGGSGGDKKKKKRFMGMF
jgi:hypothetical protein